MIITVVIFTLESLSATSSSSPTTSKSFCQSRIKVCALFRIAYLTWLSRTNSMSRIAFTYLTVLLDLLKNVISELRRLLGCIGGSFQLV